MFLLVRSLLAAWLGLLATTTLLAAETDHAKQAEFFEAKIRPVLIENCYECHNSHDSAEGDFSVDHRQALRKGGASGVMLVPGKPDESKLLAILRHEVSGMEMPQGGPKLDDAVIQDFQTWIATGAFDPRDQAPSAEEASAATSWEATLQRRKAWWSFQPITTPQVPTVEDPQWNSNPIDRFVHQRHIAQGLQPVDIAPPAVLVRRLYFNLTGLPPSPDEAQHWSERLTSASAAERDIVYTQLVDQLLASPHFGERWARHWMDWTRYAESHGSEGDPAIDQAWRYRDYLIRGLNADVPVDQLIREHVAGDLLPNPRVNEALGINESVLGTAHWRMVFHGYSPTDALDERVRFTDDQINCFSKAFLGLTVSCARCHDHKFDAISQADYYALYGILASCRPGRTAIDLPERINTHRDELENLKRELRQTLATDWQAASNQLAEKLRKRAEAAPDTAAANSPWRVLPAIHAEVAQGKTFADAWSKVQADWQTQLDQQAALQTTWNLADPNDYSVWYPRGAGLPKEPQKAGVFAIETKGNQALRGIYPAGVYSHAISDKLPARLTSPDVLLKAKGEVWVQVAGEGDAQFRYVVQDYPRSGTIYPTKRLTPAWQWVRFDVDYWAGDTVHLELTTAKDAPLLVQGPERSWFGIRQAAIRYPDQPVPQDFPEWAAALLPVAQQNPPQSLDDLMAIYQQAIQQAIAAWQDNQMSDSQAMLLQHCLGDGLLPNQLAALPKSAPLIARYRQLEAEIPAATRVPTLDETHGADQAIYLRGDHKKPGELVPRRFLEAIDATPYRTPSSGRLELADKLLRDDNPFTRRVMVNRIWHHLFGQGIFRTPDNLGKMGDQPSDPQLLDWLAQHFAQEGWSLKRQVREIVLSRTWQLASTPSATQRQQDPENRTLAHANVRRMEAEAIRDWLLAVSGKLDDTHFGPPVADQAPRRSIYLRVIRNDLNPLLRVFDFPEPFSTVGRRDVTNVPAQSLTLLNDPQIEAYADAWAQKVSTAPDLSTDEARIQRMFASAFGRAASDEEVARCEVYLASIRQRTDSLRQQQTSLKNQLAAVTSQLSHLKQPIRQQLEAARNIDRTSATTNAPRPIAQWDFAQSTEDQIGTAHGKLIGGATVEAGALQLRNQGYLITAPLKHNLTAKTLEAWVQLDNLAQQGGGVMSVQLPGGNVFDAIVFGEQQAGHWLAGSNNFARTQPYSGSAETEASNQPVHVAIAYHADGRVTAYRNGQPYGATYKSSGPFPFVAGNTVVTLGLRHLPGTGNRFLNGTIYQARLYDTALSAEQISLTASQGPTGVSDEQVLDAMDAATRAEASRLQQETASLESQLGEIDAAGLADAQLPWKELARALITFKEFIYVR
ncbi:DUF1553 domain-containing protein [Blastopirellula marina]|uniref:Cytochrome c domain-containing protein n=1 Tax=Blastopirellula marina TaxID=124 RepID=A0A2S8GBV1_9BACT|nr:DUF1553 domain-containing protein [Blastopirellula marina]PQO41917.1 hypothetical protein C5Y98_02450 [Blastopirellula marina]PTL46275.1 DUF1553 domain-containing protein [Blastopirellula marina]